MADIKLGRYRHFKGKEYEVVAIAKHSETLEDMVVYRKCYDDLGYWVRPLTMFGETVVKDGQEMLRFQYIEEE